jgi:hypothetical protein
LILALALVFTGAKSLGAAVQQSATQGTRSEEAKPDTVAADVAAPDTVRPPARPPFDAIDAIELPFRVVLWPVALVLDGVFLLVERLTLPSRPSIFVRALQSMNEARAYPGVGSIGRRSGLSAKMDVYSFEPFFLQTGISVRGSQRHRAGLTFGDAQSGLEASYGFRRDAAVRFWGIGGTTPEANRAEYLRDRQEAGVRGRAQVSPRVDLGASVLYEDNRVDRALGSEVGVPDLFDPVPYGFQERTRFVRFDVSAGLDLTHREALQVRGASLRVGASLFRGVNGTDTDFHRFGADLRGFVPLNRRQILAVRAFAELNRLDDGPDIPFFHLASVGSTTGLRGFSSDRFTDTDSFGVMSEWRWEIWRDLHERSRSEFFLFFDTAGVGPGLSNITTSGVRFSWGLGMRLLTLQRYIGHWYLGFSEEGTRFRIDNSVIF